MPPASKTHHRCTRPGDFLDVRDLIGAVVHRLNRAGCLRHATGVLSPRGPASDPSGRSAATAKPDYASSSTTQMAQTADRTSRSGSTNRHNPCNGSGAMPTSARCPRRIGHAIHGQGASARVEGVRPGCAVAVRLDAGHSRESFAVTVESNAFDDPVEVRRIKHQVAHEVLAEVDMRPRNVVVVGPGTIPKTPSGKLRRGVGLAARLTGFPVWLAGHE